MKINGSSDWEKINNSQYLENSEYLKNSENDYSEKDIFDLSCGDGVVDENSIFVDEENKQIFLDSDLFAEEVTFDDYKNANVNELFELEDLESYNFLTAEKEMSFDDIEFLKLQDSFQITSLDVKLSNDEKRLHEDSKSVKKSITKEDFDKHNGDGKIDENSIYFDEENKTIYLDKDFTNNEHLDNISIDDLDFLNFGWTENTSIENIQKDLFYKLYDLNESDTYNIICGEESSNIPATLIKKMAEIVILKENPDFDRNNINNVVDKTYTNAIVNVDENKQKTSETSIEVSYNKNGDEVKKVTKEYDADGNLVSTQVIEKIYDKYGTLREDVSIQYDADGNEQIQLIEKFDLKGRPIEEITKLTNEDSSTNERITSLSYGDGYEKDSCVYSATEVIISKDKDGNIIYKTTSSASNNDGLNVLKESYPNDKRIQKAETFEQAFEICKQKGLTEEVNAKIYDNLKTSLYQAESKVEEMNEEMVLAVVDELKAKLDLMAINNDKKGEYLDLLEQIRKNDNSYIEYKYELPNGKVIWSKEENYQGREPKGQRRTENTLDRIPELQKLYQEINAQMYPDGSHGSLGQELIDIQSSKNYFNGVDETYLDTSVALSDGFDPKTGEPKTYGDYLFSQLNDFKEKYENNDELLLMDQRITELCEAFGYSVTMEDIGKMLEKYETELKNVLKTGKVTDTSKIADYINKTIEDEESIQSIQNEFKISTDYDPETMIANNYGEMLMEQMNDLKKEYQLYKDQMGSFDKVISMCNVFGFGTSEAEVEKMFEVYEQELRALSETEGDEFIHKFKALTGNDFTKDSMINLYSYNMISESIESLSVEELEKQAEMLGFNLPDDAEISVYRGSTTDPNGISYPHYSKEYSVDALRVLVKDRLTSGLSQNNKTTDKAIDDWKDTVVEHRDFVVDLARTSATAIVSSTGVGVIGCALTGAMVEATVAAMNANASGEQKLSAKEVAGDIVSGAISSGFQGGAVRFLNGLGFTTSGDIDDAGSIYKLIQKIFKKNDYTIMNKTLFKFCELFGLKGVTAGVIKETSNFMFEESDLIMKCCSGEATEAEQDELVAKFLDGIKSGFIDGAATGVLLTFFDHINSKSGKKIYNKLKLEIDESISVATQSGSSDKLLKALNFLNDYGYKFASATGKTAMRTSAKVFNGKDVDSSYIINTEFKEIAKEVFK